MGVTRGPRVRQRRGPPGSLRSPPRRSGLPGARHTLPPEAAPSRNTLQGLEPVTLPRCPHHTGTALGTHEDRVTSLQADGPRSVHFQFHGWGSVQSLQSGASYSWREVSWEAGVRGACVWPGKPTPFGPDTRRREVAELRSVALTPGPLLTPVPVPPRSPAQLLGDPMDTSHTRPTRCGHDLEGPHRPASRVIHTGECGRDLLTSDQRDAAEAMTSLPGLDHKRAVAPPRSSPPSHASPLSLLCGRVGGGHIRGTWGCRGQRTACLRGPWTLHRPGTPGNAWWHKLLLRAICREGVTGHPGRAVGAPMANACARESQAP